jgi:hypothetical protein
LAHLTFYFFHLARPQKSLPIPWCSGCSNTHVLYLYWWLAWFWISLSRFLFRHKWTLALLAVVFMKSRCILSESRLFRTRHSSINRSALCLLIKLKLCSVLEQHLQSHFTARVKLILKLPLVCSLLNKRGFMDTLYK